jgi:hypothetical protein
MGTMDEDEISILVYILYESASCEGFFVSCVAVFGKPSRFLLFQRRFYWVFFQNL